MEGSRKGREFERESMRVNRMGSGRVEYEERKRVEGARMAEEIGRGSERCTGGSRDEERNGDREGRKLGSHISQATPGGPASVNNTNEGATAFNSGVIYI